MVHDVHGPALHVLQGAGEASVMVRKLLGSGEPRSSSVATETTSQMCHFSVPCVKLQHKGAVMG